MDLSRLVFFEKFLVTKSQKEIFYELFISKLSVNEPNETNLQNGQVCAINAFVVWIVIGLLMSVALLHSIFLNTQQTLFYWLFDGGLDIV